MEDQRPFSVDLETISPEEVITSMTQEEMREVLGSHKNILYIGIKMVQVYSIEEWQVFIWRDQRGRENTLFIGGTENASDMDQIHWYQDRKLTGKTTKKIEDKRDFIEQCVWGKDITPENLS